MKISTVLIIAALADITIIAGASGITYFNTHSVLSSVIAGLLAAIALVTVDIIGRTLLVRYLISNPEAMPNFRRFMGL